LQQSKLQQPPCHAFQQQSLQRQHSSSDSPERIPEHSVHLIICTQCAFLLAVLCKPYNSLETHSARALLRHVQHTFSQTSAEETTMMQTAFADRTAFADLITRIIHSFIHVTPVAEAHTSNAYPFQTPPTPQIDN
jgi:hypothetical protein